MKLDIRQRILDDREKIYSKYAFLDRNSKGRVYEESPSEVREIFKETGIELFTLNLLGGLNTKHRFLFLLRLIIIELDLHIRLKFAR